MQPAYPISLDETTLACLGELCAIQGQIEFLMHGTVELLLELHGEGHTILGSTNIGANAEVWRMVIRRKCKVPELAALGERIYSEIAKLAQGRNDFVHAIFGAHKAEGGITYPAGPPEAPGYAVAVRTKTRKARPATELQKVRDHAALISVMMAHLNYEIRHLGWPDSAGPKPTSPWLGRF